MPRILRWRVRGTSCRRFGRHFLAPLVRWVLLGVDGDLGDADEHVGFHGVGLEGFV
ncbi:hypothetical protein RCH07_003783, partial [Arthrobacter sp. CG_A4]|nr:hypothetical protein [Arthrobacter sp. CG_A4]